MVKSCVSTGFTLTAEIIADLLTLEQIDEVFDLIKLIEEEKTTTNLIKLIRKAKEIMNETETLSKLIKDGYRVEVINPCAVKLNEKYHVYKKLELGDLLLKKDVVIERDVILDESGEIVGIQG